jgi:hypothetical protein
MYSFGENQSAKYNEYRDMDNGFLGELSLKGEMKDAPYYFDFGMKNPTRDDQWYEGAFGRFGMFHLELGYNETPHVLSKRSERFTRSGAYSPCLRRCGNFHQGRQPDLGRGRAAITHDRLLRPVEWVSRW